LFRKPEIAEASVNISHPTDTTGCLPSTISFPQNWSVNGFFIHMVATLNHFPSTSLKVQLRSMNPSLNATSMIKSLKLMGYFVSCFTTVDDVTPYLQCQMTLKFFSPPLSENSIGSLSIESHTFHHQFQYDH